MQSLFDQQVSNDLIKRVNQLSATATPQWGKMNVGQMLAHCKVGFKVATGETRIKRAFLGLIFGRLGKKQLLTDKPFGKNLPTAKEFIFTGEADFNEEKTTLVNYLTKVQQGGPSVFTTEPHPFFGKMSTAEWDALMYKHLDHHLRQFGV
jgi:hypothetical protein